MILSIFTIAYADNKNVVTPNDAKKMASFHIANDIKLSEESGWDGEKITLSSAKKVYDADDNLKAYVFNVVVDNKKSGFILVGSSFDEFPILSFSYDGEAFNEDAISNVKKGINEEIVEEKIVQGSPGNFAVKFKMKDGSEKIKFQDGEEIKLKRETVNLESKKISKEKSDKIKEFWKNTAGEIGTTSDGVTDVDPDNWETGYDSKVEEYLSDVPDLNQWKYDGTHWIGCSPTAGSNVIAWWANSSSTYSDLMPTTQTDVALDLFDTMDTHHNPGEVAGSTSTTKIDDGLEDYAENLGFSATSTNYGSWALNDSFAFYVYRNDISYYGPNVLSIEDQDYYGDHSVTGVGYIEYTYNGSSDNHQYMIVHDNHSTTTKTVYLAYGRNYTTALMTTFKID